MLPASRLALSQVLWSVFARGPFLYLPYQEVGYQLCQHPEEEALYVVQLDHLLSFLAA